MFLYLDSLTDGRTFWVVDYDRLENIYFPKSLSHLSRLAQFNL